jgi:hypothetical protein
VQLIVLCLALFHKALIVDQLLHFTVLFWQVQTYCKPTGRRQEVTCSTDAQRKSDKHADAVAANIVVVDAPGMHAIGGTVTYQSCLRTEQDELVSFAM